MVDITLRYTIAFMLPVLSSLVLTPLIIKLALAVGAVDQPGERKIHTEGIPRFGGVAIFLSIALSFVLLYIFRPLWFTGIFDAPYQAIAIGIAVTAVMALGMWDDLKPLGPGIKFGVQFLIASAVYFSGFQISIILDPLALPFRAELLDFPLTILWIIGITNAFNLIDGLDGLAAGVGTIASIAIFVASASVHQPLVPLFALMLAGSTVGFLRFNFNPARIFMGDSGSLFLGCSLALLSVLSATTASSSQFSMLFPIIVLGLPITDTLLSILRRFLGSYLTNNPTSRTSTIIQKVCSVFKPDKEHIHHQILLRGLTHRNTVILLYTVSALFALSALLISSIGTFKELIALLAICLAALIWGVKKLRYREIDVFRNGLFLSVYERFILNKVLFLSLLDILFITIAYSLPFYLLDQLNPELVTATEFRNGLLVACVTQLGVFWLSGLYRENLLQMGVGDVLHITRSVCYSVAVLAILLPIIGISEQLPNLPLIILNFYLLLTLVLGLRISYTMLRYIYLFNQKESGKDKVLIYGANEHGTLLLQQLLADSHHLYTPIGFLDNDPSRQGTYINGYKVLGGLQKLGELKEKYQFNTIFIPDVVIEKNEIDHLKQISASTNLVLKKVNIGFEDLEQDPINTGLGTDAQHHIPGSDVLQSSN